MSDADFFHVFTGRIREFILIYLQKMAVKRQ